MKQLFFLLIIIISCKSQKEKALFIDVTGDIVEPAHYIITKAKKTIIIDGIADEPDWQSALFSDPFIDIEGIETPLLNTKFKLLWDDYNLYVYAIMEEAHIWGNLKQRDTIIYFNNDFEVFIDPSSTTENYAEIEINALGTIWDLLLDKPYRVGGKAIGFWDLKGLKSAVQIKGTLNDATDIDSFWAVEMAIPIKALMELKAKTRRIPVEGEQWRMNFSRVEWDFDTINGTYHRKQQNGKLLRENNWVWSNQKVINMHEPEKWGIVQFTDSTHSENVNFIEDKDQNIKQAVWALFRQTRRGKLNYLQEEKTNIMYDVRLKFAENKKITAKFMKTNFGYEYLIKSPETGISYAINEEGLIKILQ